MKPIKDLLITKMKKKDFLSLPARAWNEDIGVFDSLVIIPTRYKHESGYMCMDFVACVGEHPVCRLSGCSDVVYLDGIGGYGLNNWYKKRESEIINETVLEETEVKNWTIDCLPCGYLRLLSARNGLVCGLAVSDFQIYSVVDKK